MERAIDLSLSALLISFNVIIKNLPDGRISFLLNEINYMLEGKEIIIIFKINFI